MSAHYITENKEIYQKFFTNEKITSTFPIIYERKRINGNFLEKYLELLLKLKVVVAAFSYYAIDKLFYNIEYITYIFLGHGPSYFKSFLYNNYLNYKRFDKMVIPPSNRFISIAKKYGWKDEDIIKMCLPRWDNYNDVEDYTTHNNSAYLNTNKSIFLMFTWRRLKQNKEICKYYLINLIKILTNKKLNKNLIKKNITLFFTYHHDFRGNKIINSNLNNYIKIIEQSQISECIKNSSLIITDFSSVVFDFIYRKKPFVLFIPDSNDPLLEENYITQYIDVIKGLKNDSIYFKNKYFNVKDTINKVIYYMNRDFIIEPEIKKFYDEFNLTGKNNTNNFINYIHNLK